MKPGCSRRLVAVLGALAALGLASVYGKRMVIINTSPSVPCGLYIRSSEGPHVGAIVDFRIPAAAQSYVWGRTGNAGGDWYIIKPIIAGPGDRVDTTGRWLKLNDIRIAPMPPAKDSQGRLLPIWRDRRSLNADEFFVFSGRIPNSFDSRCYGPIRREQIEAVRTLLITW